MSFPKRFPGRDISEPLLVFNSVSDFREVGVVLTSLPYKFDPFDKFSSTKTNKQLWTFVNHFRYSKTNLT